MIVLFNELGVVSEFVLEVGGQLIDQGTVVYIECAAYAITLITHDDG